MYTNVVGIFSRVYNMALLLLYLNRKSTVFFNLFIILIDYFVFESKNLRHAVQKFLHI